MQVRIALRTNLELQYHKHNSECQHSTFSIYIGNLLQFDLINLT